MERQISSALRWFLAHAVSVIVESLAASCEQMSSWPTLQPIHACHSAIPRARLVAHMRNKKNVSPACESMTSIPTCIRFHSRSNPCRMRVACVCVFKWRKSITVIIWLYEIGKFIVCLLIHAFCACTALRFGYDECVIILCGRLDVWHV